MSSDLSALASKSEQGLGNSDEAGFIVSWDENDPSDPHQWSKTRKWIITLSVSTITGLSAGVSSVIAIGYPSMKSQLGCTELQATATLSLFAAGFAITPLVLAPLSEEWGRRPIYVVSSALMTLFFIPIATAHNVQTVMAVRLLQGAAASTGSAMVGGSIADLWSTSERGFPMSMVSWAVLAICGFGPAVAGVIEENLDWRWIQWIAMMFSGVFTIWLVIFGCPETRGTILLARKAKQLRKKTGDQRYRTAVPLPSLRDLIWISTTRPVYLMFTEPIVASFSLWIGFAWGLVYILIESIGLVFQDLYGFSSSQVGLAFLAIAVGSSVGFLSNFYQEKLYRKHFPRIGVEARLYSACVAGVTFSLGLFLYAWTSYSFVHWIAPCIGIVIIVASTFVIYQAVFNYLADSYQSYASSALAGQSLARNLMGTAFPLFTQQLYHKLNFRWGGTLIACVAAVLAPIPFVLFWYGPSIRAGSRFASGLVHVGAGAVVEAEKEEGQRERDGGEAGADTKVLGVNEKDVMRETRKENVPA